MSTGKIYLKCKCPHCGAEVAYPDYAGGGASACGRCGKTVLLPRAVAVAPPPPVAAAKTMASPPAPPTVAKPPPVGVKRVEPSSVRAVDPPPAGRRRGSFLRVCLWGLNLAIVLAAGFVVVDHLKNRPASSPDEGGGTAPVTATPAAPSGPAPAAKSDSPTVVTPSPNPPSVTAPTNSQPAVTVPKGPKLIGDLKVTQVALDQPKGAKGSRLVYVTGVLKNDSDHQRFGVRVELDLFDAAGNKVGTATDYRQSLEPRATWQFRGIVTDRRATAAKFAGVKEDE
ncbi:MAG: hypothetical protein EBS84_10410 [Proteobacteria bacterium]|nr:hypothetical protein [Verrucomicrobiota bacterium]NBU09415.1 hypothetical protein [Pseudomonadota bacterium]